MFWYFYIFFFLYFPLLFIFLVHLFQSFTSQFYKFHADSYSKTSCCMYFSFVVDFHIISTHQSQLSQGVLVGRCLCWTILWSDDYIKQCEVEKHHAWVIISPNPFFFFHTDLLCFCSNRLVDLGHYTSVK